MRWKRNQDMTSNFPLNLERISFLLKSVLENKHFHEVFFHSYQIIDTNSCWSTIILMFHLIIQTSVITQSLIKSSQWAKKRRKTVQSGSERGKTKLLCKILLPLKHFSSNCIFKQYYIQPDPLLYYKMIILRYHEIFSG